MVFGRYILLQEDERLKLWASGEGGGVHQSVLYLRIFQENKAGIGFSFEKKGDNYCYVIFRSLFFEKFVTPGKIDCFHNTLSSTRLFPLGKVFLPDIR